MARPLKDIIVIGDSFENWTVFAKEVNDKKYNYNFICKCQCGAMRVIKKHDLVNNNLPTCQECKNSVIINNKYELIKQHWHTTLNRREVPNINLLDLETKYWFKCKAGHVYNTTIKNLTKECPVCVEEIIRNNNNNRLKIVYDKLVEFVSGLLEVLYPSATVETLDTLYLLKINIPEKNTQVLVYPKLHLKYNRLYHEDKKQFLNNLEQIRHIDRAMDNGKDNIAKLELEMDFVRDMEKIKHFIKLLHKE